MRAKRSGPLAPAGAPRDALSLRAFAHRIGATRPAVYAWRRKGWLPPAGYTDTGRPYWSEAEVRAYHASPLGRRRAMQRKSRIALAMKRCARRQDGQS